MKIDDIEVVLSRVERVTKEYDSKGLLVRETVEYYFPPDKERPIGFKKT